MNSRHLVLVAALALAGGLAFFGNPAPQDDVVAATPRPSGPPSAGRSLAPQRQDVVIDDIIAVSPRERLYPLSEKPRRSRAPGLFASHGWQPPAPPLRAGARMAPTAPTLPFAYLGKKREDGVWEVYLGRGEQSLIVRERNVVDGAWRVDAIRPPTMTFTYLPLNQGQILIIGGMQDD